MLSCECFFSIFLLLDQLTKFLFDWQGNKSLGTFRILFILIYKKLISNFLEQVSSCCTKNKNMDVWPDQTPLVETRKMVFTGLCLGIWHRQTLQFQFYKIQLLCNDWVLLPLQREVITCLSASSRCSLLEVELLSSSSELWISSSSEWTSCPSQPLPDHTFNTTNREKIRWCT